MVRINLLPHREQKRQARADLATVQANLGRQFPKPDAQISATVAPLRESTVAGVRSSLWNTTFNCFFT